MPSLMEFTVTTQIGLYDSAGKMCLFDPQCHTYVHSHYQFFLHNMIYQIIVILQGPYAIGTEGRILSRK